MVTKVQNGATLDVVVPSGTVNVGQVVLIGAKLGVIHSTNNNKATAGAGDVITVETEGVFEIPKSSIGRAATALLKVTTGATAADELAQMSVNVTALFASALVFTGGDEEATAQEIVDKINAYTGTSTYTAVMGSGGYFTIVGTIALGATINGVIPGVGTITGDVVIGQSKPFKDGITTIGTDSGTSFKQGAKAYWDDTNKVVTSVAEAAIGTTSAMSAQGVTTGFSAAGTLASITVDGIDLLAPGGITSPGGNPTQSAQQIVDAINAYTGTSGFTGSVVGGGAFEIFGPSALGASLNGLLVVYGAITGTLVLIDPASGPFSGGVTEQFTDIGNVWENATNVDNIGIVKLKV